MAFLRRVPTRAVWILFLALIALAASNAQRAALAGVHAYQHALSPLVTRAGLHCRFVPTCSRYAQVVIERDGALRGGWASLKRVVRCNPLTPVGTRDEP